MVAPLLLHQQIQRAVGSWREVNYRHPVYPGLAEILRWAIAPEGAFQLRAPQLMALERYWYLRLILDTPHVANLYTQLFPDATLWAQALAVPESAWRSVGASRERFLRKLQEDESFVREFGLESVGETMALPYPSYIFALAMGVGKTVLIGSLIASEFALALAYPDGPFLQNALVFAPGRTIVEALRELIAMPYHALLPPHLHKPFMASVRFVVPQDGERTIPVLPGSAFNVVITNTEKIRIQKEKIRKTQVGYQWPVDQMEEAKAEVANLRLQTIASLPNLGIFSDEAHHTYGRTLGTGLKKVRKTVDYIASQTTVHLVVNTTGTPYFGRQPLHDVVATYGLAAGIRDGVLKEVGDNLIVYGMEGERYQKRQTRNDVADYTLPNGHNAEGSPLGLILRDIVTDFLATYGDVTLPNGTPAKLAIFFPKTADIALHRPLLERLLVELGYAPTLLLEHHTHCDNKGDFDRFHTRHSPHRIVLLVDRGVEGWDVPALFACALVRKLKSSNNFLLQAASRCLRQVPGNTHSARIYLSAENQKILARQLRNTYGNTLTDVTTARTIRHHSSAPPKLAVHPQQRELPKQCWLPPVALQLSPSAEHVAAQSALRGKRSHVTFEAMADSGDGEQSVQLAELSRSQPSTIPDAVLCSEDAPPVIDLYTAAVELAGCYHLAPLQVYQALRTGYA
ncbi:MAG: DEAD/DEAH box helicase family protein, partial [Caldilineaceae bacterium]|nr:DEAD/DEAH box helicase family protein [Caldilineaceae bacterium]